MLIKPITVRMVAYGKPQNLAAIRGRAEDLLKEEHGKVDPAAFATLTAQAAHDEIAATRWDAEVPLLKPTASQAGVAITLTDVHERGTTDWLHELPVAKTCVAFATWRAEREPGSWQLLMAQGGRWSENRPV